MVIDSMITGRFLGTTAFTASGLFTPVNLLCNLVLSLLGLGVGVICTRYMGMAKPERVNQVFSVVIIALLAGSPRLLAASICPLSTACIPPLNISDMYAPAFRKSVITPAVKAVSLKSGPIA